MYKQYFSSLCNFKTLKFPFNPEGVKITVKHNETSRITPNQPSELGMLVHMLTQEGELRSICPSVLLTATQGIS